MGVPSKARLATESTVSPCCTSVLAYLQCVEGIGEEGSGTAQERGRENRRHKQWSSKCLVTVRGRKVYPERRKLRRAAGMEGWQLKGDKLLKVD